jgi:hypothetical protein
MSRRTNLRPTIFLKITEKRPNCGRFILLTLPFNNIEKLSQIFTLLCFQNAGPFLENSL